VNQTVIERLAGVSTLAPLRVVHVVSTLSIGGLEKVVLDLARHRTRDRFTMHVICLDRAGVLKPEFESLGVPVHVIGTRGLVPTRIWRLARRLKEIKPDVLHTHNPQAHLHGAIAARLARVPLVVHTKHGRDYMDGNWLAAGTRLATRWTSRIVGVSEDAALVALEMDGVPADKVRVIHNGVDLDRFDVRVARPTRPHRRAVTVGRLTAVKDQATLIRAVGRVVAEVPDFQLDIVGDGPARRELEMLRDSLGLTDHVHFRGYHSRVGDFLATADFFVLSSLSEGVSLALLEAMASGLPVVATDVGGNGEVVVPGETGYLAPPNSPELLAAQMLRLADNAAEISRMGRAARRRVTEHFNLRTVVAEYEEMYTQQRDRGLPAAVMAS